MADDDLAWLTCHDCNAQFVRDENGKIGHPEPRCAGSLLWEVAMSVDREVSTAPSCPTSE